MIFQLFGQITPPESPISISPDPAGNVITLINFGLRIVFFLAGLVALWNFVSAGFQLIGSSGDPKALDAVRGKFIWTAFGLFVMVIAIVVAGIIGIMVYDDWDAIINPTFVTQEP